VSEVLTSEAKTMADLYGLKMYTPPVTNRDGQILQLNRNLVFRNADIGEVGMIDTDSCTEAIETY
jgi:hypothetical protein